MICAFYNSFPARFNYESMTAHSIQTVCICGAGTMGAGIAQNTAQHGYYTILFDVQQAMLDKAKAGHEKSLQQLVTKGKITQEQAQETKSRLVYTADINDGIADLIIEAIVEKKEIKISLFNQLAEINHSETLFVSNTSSLSINEIAAGVMHPQRVAGLHFFNPATVMKLVEVVAATHTLPQMIETLRLFCQSLGKTPVVCQDAPGFIVNRVARPYYIESLRMAEAGIPIETIDAALQGIGFKMGPFKLMDLIGNDVNFAVSNSVWEQLGKPDRLKPSFIQEAKVTAKEWGVKTGKGYYDYPAPKSS